MIAETRDASVLNYFGSHPDIASEIGATDFTNAVRETAVFLFGEHGGFIYEWCAPGTYEVHVLLTKAGRGPWGFAAAKRSVAMMAELGAAHIWARIGQPHVGLFAAKAGFRDAGEQTLYGPEPRRWRIMNWRKPCPHP